MRTRGPGEAARGDEGDADEEELEKEDISMLPAPVGDLLPSGRGLEEPAEPGESGTDCANTFDIRASCTGEKSEVRREIMQRRHAQNA